MSDQMLCYTACRFCKDYQISTISFPVLWVFNWVNQYSWKSKVNHILKEEVVSQKFSQVLAEYLPTGEAES